MTAEWKMAHTLLETFIPHEATGYVSSSMNPEWNNKFILYCTFVFFNNKENDEQLRSIDLRILAIHGAKTTKNHTPLVRFA